MWEGFLLELKGSSSTPAGPARQTGQQDSPWEDDLPERPGPQTAEKPLMKEGLRQTSSSSPAPPLDRKSIIVRER